ncbi:hypothetical protein ACIPSA_16470 [Streptomyces sp. NPDC086549]|uniref:hypothetical protein n=1 Tax=Streptomyces sp. NPDC086549 TaxID=3365752 RepID=UPI00382A0FFD
MRGIGLGSARVGYLVMSGAAFFVAALRADPAEMGRFALASAYAGIAVVVLDMGLSRVVLMKFAVRPRGSDAMAQIVRVRAPVYALLAALLLVLARAVPDLTGAAGLVASRLALGDVEALNIAGRRSTATAIATLVNGLITMAGLVLAAPHGVAAMLWASVLGNLVALTVLVVSAWDARPDARASTERLRWQDAWAFGLMAVVGVVYLRSSIAVLGPIGVLAVRIASFAVAFKLFELIVAMRGALVQRLAVDLATTADPVPLMRQSILQISVVSGSAGLLAVLVTLGLRTGSLLGGYPQLWDLALVVAASTPLIMSHCVTSAWVYSRSGSVAALLDSVLLALVAFTGAALGALVDLRLVMFATCVMEYVSFLAFSRRVRPTFLRSTRTWMPPLLTSLPGLVVASVVIR